MVKGRARLALPLSAQCSGGAGARLVSGEPEARMDQETVGNVVLLVIVTLISVVQNAFFAHKVEHESKTQNGRSFQRTGTLAFERVYTANSCCLRRTDVSACEAKVLRGLSGRENSEHPWLHIRQADHLVPVPHVPCRSTQPLPHLLLRK
ncbi:arachidonate 5-lipoxygenase-activating protein isoform X2 [Peromyscus maniculatus bairdii]|uniref:arachidonate 5-lipoxygenase-activating protein isoform X2 n=1 Tax=Peromyscus maniculatus bairdii TaxID=230844 RepID=UPI003FD28E15